MHLQIDGDVLLYKCGFAAEKTHYKVIVSEQGDEDGEYPVEDAKAAKKLIADLAERGITGDRVAETEIQPLGFAIQNINTKITSIMEATRGSTFTIWLSGGNNFRDQLVDDYKANRPERKPHWFKQMKQYLIDHYHAETTYGQEADDAMSIAQYSAFQPSMIVTIDKDLKMVPGRHCNLDTLEMSTVTIIEGLRLFYKQIITGDSTDNIKGLYKMLGIKATQKYLAPIDEMDDELSMWLYVLSVFDGIPEEEVITNARLLWMRSKEEEMWEPPTNRIERYLTEEELVGC